MSYIILAINPGSTSTKIAVYEDTQPVLSLAIGPLLRRRDRRVRDDRRPVRMAERPRARIAAQTADSTSAPSLPSSGRGGLVHPVEGGVYEVNDALHDDLLHARRQHASNLAD